MKKTVLSCLFAVFCMGTVVAEIRIVSLSPGSTEILASLNMTGALVGVTEACDYPDVVAGKPKVGPYLSPDSDAIQALKPTIVIGIGVPNSPNLSYLEGQGITVLLLPNPDDITDLLTAITIIGQAVGKGEEAQKLAGDLNLLTQKLREKRPKTKLSVLTVIWNPPLMGVAGNTLVASIVSAAGGVNTLDTGSVRYPKIDRQLLLYRNPEVVVIVDPTLVKRIMEESPIAFTQAATQQRIVSDIPAAWLIRPGPRFVLGIQALQTILKTYVQ